MIDGDAVVHELVLPAPPADVFEMFIDAEKLVTWIGISADLEARPDGRFRFELMLLRGAVRDRPAAAPGCLHLGMVGSEHGRTAGVVDGRGDVRGGRCRAEHAATFYVSVDDPAKTLEQVEAKGGKTVLPVMEVPDGPTIALFADPAGNTIGLRKA